MNHGVYNVGIWTWAYSLWKILIWHVYIQQYNIAACRKNQICEPPVTLLGCIMLLWRTRGKNSLGRMCAAPIDLHIWFNAPQFPVFNPRRRRFNCYYFHFEENVRLGEITPVAAIRDRRLKPLVVLYTGCQISNFRKNFQTELTSTRCLRRSCSH